MGLQVRFLAPSQSSVYDGRRGAGRAEAMIGFDDKDAAVRLEQNPLAHRAKERGHRAARQARCKPSRAHGDKVNLAGVAEIADALAGRVACGVRVDRDLAVHGRELGGQLARRGQSRLDRVARLARRGHRHGDDFVARARKVEGIGERVERERRAVDACKDAHGLCRRPRRRVLHNKGKGGASL
eukprot:Amastigsp_a676257_860.p2 type:complete len:184 gc:universal Amastigsp_a676257_860:1048-497(-)